MAHAIIIKLLPRINTAIGAHKPHHGRRQIGKVRNCLCAEPDQVHIFIEHDTAVNTGKFCNDIRINREILFSRCFRAQIISFAFIEEMRRESVFHIDNTGQQRFIRNNKKMSPVFIGTDQVHDLI